jgi:hypothetical protein
MRLRRTAVVLLAGVLIAAVAVGVHRLDRETRAGEGEAVTADAAAEVGDAGDARAAQPDGMHGGDAEARGLLETGAGEQHPVGELAELRPGANPQVRLPDDGRDEVGGVAGGPQPRHRARDVSRRLDHTDLVEQRESLAREQGGQLRHLHTQSLRAGTRIA